MSPLPRISLCTEPDGSARTLGVRMFARSRRQINDPRAQCLPKIDPAFGKSTLFFSRGEQERHVPTRLLARARNPPKPTKMWRTSSLVKAKPHNGSLT
jgi:hypothetical protein